MAALIRDGKNADAEASESVDATAMVRGHRALGDVRGRLASMSREQFIDVIETLGGKYTNAVGGIGKDVSLVVIGQADWPFKFLHDMLHQLSLLLCAPTPVCVTTMTLYTLPADQGALRIRAAPLCLDVLSMIP